MAISRRATLVGALSLVSTMAANPTFAAHASDGELRSRLAWLERQNGGRLGVAILDTATGRRIENRPHERFPLCSTHKFVSAAFVLHRVDRGEESLNRRIAFGKDQLVPYSPATEKNAGAEPMTLRAVCEAAITLSDNTAANLMLASFGGPAALTRYLRTLGDHVTRLDRTEPTLNESTPGDPRDTTSPAAMVRTMGRIVLGNALSHRSRQQMATWLVANTTGGKRLRAGMPRDWRVGDKTGSGHHGVVNDIAVAWPPGRAPLIVIAYYAESQAPDEQREAVLAEVGKIAAEA